MSNIFFNKVQKKTKQSAKRMAQQLAQEPGELLERAKSQVTPDVRGEDTATEELVGKEDSKMLDKNNEQQFQQNAKIRLQELENELNKLRQNRKEREKTWIEEQGRIMSSAESVEEKRDVLVEPSSKPSRGMAGAAAATRKKKQGTREVSKGPSG